MSRVSRVSAAEAAREIDPAAASYLRFLALKTPELEVYEHADGYLAVGPHDGGGLAAILGPRRGHPMTASSGEALARATTAPFVFAMGPDDAMRGFLHAREGLPESASWKRVGLSQEMLFRATPDLRPTSGVVRAPLGEGPLLPPFDAWMRAFVAELFEGPMRPPPVMASDLWTIWEGEEPVSMAGALSRGPDAVRVVTVYTPPALRGRGYAGALVAAMAQRAGVAHVTLDYSLDAKANPRTAYERAGFRPTVVTERWARV